MKPNKADAIGFLTLVCIAGAGYFVLIHPQNRRLAAAKARIAELTRCTLANEGIVKVLERERASLGSLQEKLGRYADTFAGKKQLDAFLRRFAAEAEKAGVNVSQLRPGKPKKSPCYEITPINVNVEGRFAGVYRLLRDIETGQLMATLEKLQIQSEPGRSTCRAVLTLNLYLKTDSGV